MITYTNTVIAEHERGLLFRDGRLDKVLTPGRNRLLSLGHELRIQRCDLSDPVFSVMHAQLLFDSAAGLLETHLHQVVTGNRQLALVRYDGELSDIVPPHSRRLYWREPLRIEVEPVDLAEGLRIADRLRAELMRRDAPVRLSQAIANYVHSAEVADRHVGLLFIDGEYRETLPPGGHAFWSIDRKVHVAVVDGRLQSMEVAGQEILSRDKVSLRVNLSATWQVEDAVRAWRESSDYREQLYRELQFALRKAIGTRTLDSLLADRQQLDRTIHDAVAARAKALGLRLIGVGLKDIILPGEMKAILNQVVEAEKQAQANVIRRREETAATRSALNTAKLMESNPTLMRLKELETLEKVADKVERLTVFGGLEGMMRDSVRIDA